MKHISRMLLALILFACICITSCARLEPTDIIGETTVVGDDIAEVWSYIPSDDAPVASNVLKVRDLQYYNGGLYIFSGSLFGATLYEREEVGRTPRSTLRRLDVETGELTNVCPDPLCTHSTPACPFAGMLQFALDDSGNLIYYRMFSLADESEHEYRQLQLCSYNLNTLEWRMHIDETTLETPSAFFERFLSYRGNIYYYKPKYEEQENEKNLMMWYLIRQNMQTGETEELGEPQKAYSPDTSWFLFAANDRIYFRTETEIYSTDLLLTDRKTVYQGSCGSLDVQTDGKYIFFTQKIDPESNERTIYRMDMDGNNLTDLEIRTGYEQWTITQNYIYYKRSIPRILLWLPNSNNAFSVDNDAIMRCDRNGENHEEIFVYNHPEEDKPPHYQIFTNLCPIGNYIYAMEYGMIDENKNGMCDPKEQYNYTAGTNMRINRIDITTGEVTYVEPYKDFQ